MKTYFETQEKDETVLLVIHKHWFNLSVPLVAGIALGFVIFFIYLSLKSDGPAVYTNEPIWEAFLVLLLIFDLCYIFTSWMVRYLNVVILTNKHLVEIEQHALFSRKTSVLNLSHIEDASSQKSGILQTIMDFGSIEIQTAGEMRNFIFKNYPDPDGVQKKIMIQKSLLRPPKRVQRRIDNES